MRSIVALALFLPGMARAEIAPTFHAASCTDRATHIIVVKPEPGTKDQYRVVESWKGDRKKDDLLRISALAKEANGEMVLFARYVPKHGGDEWLPADIYRDWHTSVVWLNGDQVSAVDQPINPGPSGIHVMTEVKRPAFRELVAYYVRNAQAMDAARSTTDVEKRVAALAAIVTGPSDRKEEAFTELGRCGPRALPALRRVLDGPPSHDHKYAVAALAAAGGRDVVPEIARRIEAETTWWAKEGPRLHPGWWHDSDVEAWKRHGMLFALIDVYRRQPTAALEKPILAVRDLMKNLPTVDAARGIASVSAHCDRVLKDDPE